MAVTSVTKNPPPPPPKPPAPKPAAPSPSAQGDKSPPPSAPSGSKPSSSTPTDTKPSSSTKTTLSLDSKTPAPVDPKATTVSLTAATPSGVDAPTSPAGKQYIDYSGLKKPPANPDAPTPKPTRPDPRDPNNPTPLGQTAPFNEADKPAINKLYGELIGDMNNLSSVNRSQAAAITGKDFSNIKAEMSEGAFVPQVQSFLQNIIDDGKRVEALGKDGKTYLDGINNLNTKLEDFRTSHNYTYDQMKAAIDPTTQGLMKSATEELANSTATLVDTAKTYGDRLDSKAGELLKAWDTTKHNEYKQSIVDAITTAFSLFGNVGIGGNAIVQLAVKDAAALTKGVGEAWNAVGLRGGQLGNLFGAITVTDLKAAYSGSSPLAAAGELDQKAAAGHQHLTDLKARFDKYVEDYNNQPPPDNSWYIPTV